MSPTIMQEDLARAIVANKKKPRDKRKNKGELLESVGYAPTTAKANPTKTIEQKGVKEALGKYGLTEELVTTSLVFDIENKPKNRVKELNLGAEILNMKDSSPNNNRPLIVIISSESAKRYNAPITPITEVSRA